MSAVIEQYPSLLAKVASKYSVEPSKMLETLKATAFKGDVSNAQMMALLIVADQHGLNPWTKEIYAFPDKNNGIVPVVGIDGWARIINDNPYFDGVEFDDTDNSCTCTIYRKDRSHPMRVTEYLSECKRSTGPWGSHPKRMLRHKALIQCARIAFGFSGIYDQDEAERIVEGERLDLPPKKTGTEALKDRLRVSNSGYSQLPTVEETELKHGESTTFVSHHKMDAHTGELLPFTIEDVRAAINRGEFDIAADLARSLPDNTEALLEVSVAHEKAKKS